MPQALRDGRQEACGKMGWKILKNGLMRRIGRRTVI